jgi:hypothetical protein
LKVRGRGEKNEWLPKIYQKKKGLAVNYENPAKIYIVEIKIVSLPMAIRVRENKRGEKWGSTAISC